MIKGLHKLLLTLVLAMAASTAWSAPYITFYHLDALGSPIALSDEVYGNNIIWREAYEPYGKRIRNLVGTNSGIWYTGKEEDVGAGLIYYGARWYDPMVGRFMGVDPVGFRDSNPQSFNRFAYANNNPYKFVDPDGNSPLEWLYLAGDIASAGANISAGNYGSAVFDILNIGLDLAGPPGASEVTHAAKLLKASDKVAEAAKGASNGRVFWSGSGSRKAAEAFAKETGGKTLEMTFTGKVLDKITTPGNFKYVKPLWNAASKRFAKGAEGSVDVFHSSKGVRVESAWAKKEYPILNRQGNNINYHVVK